MRMYANDKEQNQLFILLFIDVLPLFQFDARRITNTRRGEAAASSTPNLYKSRIIVQATSHQRDDNFSPTRKRPTTR